MKIKQYDVVLLKNNIEATIVEVLEENKMFIADIEYKTGTDTNFLNIDDIEDVLYPVE